MARFLRLLVALAVSAAVLTMPGLAHASESGTYVVQDGDTLIGIAGRLGTGLADLLSANNLTVRSVIMPGQRLQVPGGAGGSSGAAAGSSGAAAGSSYTVRAGDTLSGIAAGNGVSLSSLLRANNLTVRSLIMAGMVLTLPAGAAAPATNSDGSSPNRDSGTSVVLAYARAQLGRPYRFFSAGPSAFDCSGLTLAAYAQIGVTLVHHSASQAQQGTAVDFRSEPIRAGDLVFLVTRGASSINHVGMAMSSTTWIQARRPGEVVRIGPMPSESLIVAVRRFVPAD